MSSLLFTAATATLPVGRYASNVEKSFEVSSMLLAKYIYVGLSPLGVLLISAIIVAMIAGVVILITSRRER